MTTKRTPLYAEHQRLGAKIVPFGGWDMPVSYTSVLDEHHHVRSQCGIFDVSHMGEVFIQGDGARDFLQKVTINDISRLKVGEGQYSAMLNERGGMIDDVILYRVGEASFLMCVNASNIEKDFEWLKNQNKLGVDLRNESPHWAQIAVQGPRSREALLGLMSGDDLTRGQSLPYMGIMEIRLGSTTAYLARTGYTGELGFEIYLPIEKVGEVWSKFLAQSFVKPIGLGARDTLRLEACYLLYGNDMDDETSPLEAGIGWAVRWEKGDFVGREILEKQKSGQLTRKMFAFVMNEPGVPRAGMEIYLGERLIGRVTSGSVLPTVGGAGGMALLLAESAKLGDKITIDIRGKRKEAHLVKRPLYVAKTNI